MPKTNSYESDIQAISELVIDWDRLANKKILITGASGFLGSLLVNAIMLRNAMWNQNIHIIAVARNFAKLAQRFAQHKNNPLLTLLAHDITQPLPDLSSPDYVIHAASTTHPVSYAMEPVQTITANVLGTDQLLRAFAGKGLKKILFLSSVEIYGENRGDTDYFKEDYSGYIDCNSLRAGYPESKRVSEALCQAYREKFGIEISIARIARVLGNSGSEDSKAAAQFFRRAASKKSIELKSKGDQLFSYVYCSDAVASILYLLLNGKDGEAYNVANPACETTLLKLAQEIAQAAGVSVVQAVSDATEAKGYSKASKALLSIDKIQSLGWSPKVDLQNAILRTLEQIKNAESVLVS